MLTPEDARRFLHPKWEVTEERRTRRGLELLLNTGQTVILSDNGNVHVSGKGWEAISNRLQDAMWPTFGREQAKQIKHRLAELGVAEVSYFTEGLNCIQFARAPRAAIVLGWSGFIDLLRERFLRALPAFNHVFREHRRKLHAQLGDFTEPGDFEALKDKDAIELGFRLGIYDHYAKTQLDAMLGQRNTSAHVGEIELDLLIALGFYSQLTLYLPFLLKDIRQEKPPPP